MGPKPVVQRRSAEEIKQITLEARNRAYERGIENAHTAIGAAAVQGNWYCRISVADFYERIKDFTDYFTNLGYSIGFDDEDCFVFIGWREKF